MSLKDGEVVFPDLSEGEKAASIVTRGDDPDEQEG
jgi:hypothetical protein